MENKQTMIEVQNLCKSFHKLEVLKDISTTFYKNEVVSIIGPSGGGKSTFLRCLNLLEKPTSGHIVFDGVDICDRHQNKNIDLHRQKMGMVFQQFNLFNNMNVMKNLTVAPMRIKKMPKEQAEEKAVELLRKVGLAGAEAYPSQLSGGQKQRIAIVRSLMMDPEVMLFDEPTSALDPNTTRSILELLREINKTLGVTIIVITHEMKVIDQICDRVAVIDKSCIAEEGRVADVFTSPKSDIARELVLPQERPVLEPTTGGRKVRIIFNGENTQKPVISEMILACRVPVNVLFADTKSVEGAAYGHMIFELPNDEHDAEKVISWLKNSGLTWKEER